MEENLLEEILIDEELDEIEKQCGYAGKYSFPVVCVVSLNNKTNKALYFNAASNQIVPRAIKWSVSSNYVVGLPTTEDDKNGYLTRHYRHHNTGGIVAHLPSKLANEKKLKTGLYRLYKYKDGFAFKRYERIEDDNNGEHS